MTLRALIDAEWQHQLSVCPTYASVLGDRRWNRAWEDLSLDAIHAEHRHDREILRRLEAIPRASLTPDEQLDLDLFRRDREEWIAAHELGWDYLPVNHLGPLPEAIKQPAPVQNAGQLASSLRFETDEDHEDWIARLRAFGAYVDQVIALMREGIRRGLVHARVVAERLPPQIARQLVDSPEQSLFYAPFARGGAPRLAADAAAAIRDVVLPALRRFHAHLVDEYLPAAPHGAGAWQWPRGDELYAYWARRYTTTDLSVDEIHELGLSEVARLSAAMARVQREAGFDGPPAAFFHHLRTAPRFYFPSEEAMLAAYRDLTRRVDPLLPALFRTLPRAPYVVAATPAAMAPDAPTGFYYPAAEDGSRPGTYLVNTYRVDTRPRWEMVPLTLHEAVPGHHLQTTIAAELTGIPASRRFAYHMAYGEGWALYCETLGDELGGLYDDPHDRFGQLSFEMWRAVRLVVDTGIHARRWTRERAIAYFLEVAPRSELEAVNEIDRYIAMPGQALAYKIGQLTIRRLRDRAEAALGAGFDVRAFHDVVLLAGSLPLDLLERRVDAWIASPR